MEHLLAVVTGGGTGGHVIPAIAIKEAFLKKGVKVFYVGSKNGIEYKLMDNKDNTIFLNLKGVKGKKILEAAKGIILTISAFVKLFYRFVSLKPSVVVGTGGFVCFPAVLAGFLCGSRIYLQEQNAVPGASIKILSHLARIIFLGFEDARAFLPSKKTVYSGNPLRKEFVKGERCYEPHKRGEKMKILVLGGSQGANFVNKLIVETLNLLENDKFCFFHQTGEKYKKEVEEVYREKAMEAKVFSFSNDIHKYYCESHLIIARSGAMTVSEIIATLRPSILVPYPYAIYDHQRKNALTLEKIGAATIFVEGEVTPKALAEKLKNFYEQPEALKSMSEKLSMIKFTDAAEFITDKIMEDINCIKKI